MDASGSVVRLEQGCPWKEHLFDLEEELSLSGLVKFVLYQEPDSSKWRVQVIEPLFGIIIIYRIAGNVGGELKFALCCFERDPQTLNVHLCTVHRTIFNIKSAN